MSEIVSGLELEKAAISPEVYQQAVKVIVSLDSDRWGEGGDSKDPKTGLRVRSKYIMLDIDNRDTVCYDFLYRSSVVRYWCSYRG